MQNRTIVHTDNKRINSDTFRLTSIRTGESLAFIPCDSAGNFNWTGITCAPLTRTAMKTTQSNNEYSDMEEPWISIPSDDWSGGRGNKLFTEDKTRYLDGKRAQTAFQGIFNAPLEYYSTGYKKSLTNIPDGVLWHELLRDKIIQKFDVMESIDAGQIYLHMRRRGAPDGTLRLELRDSLDFSQSALFDYQFTLEDLTDTTAEFLKATCAVTLAAGSYYLVVYADISENEVYDKDNSYQVGIHKGNPNNDCLVERNGRQQMADFYLYYRISEAQDDNARWKFFTYQQLQFAVRNYINGDTPELWLNGDIGKLTAVSGATITDSSKAWETDQFAGARVGLVYQQGIENQVSCWRTIISNTADTLTLDSEFIGDLPEANTVYIINDTPLWHEITGHGLTGYVTDIHVSRNTVYFCQGDHIDIQKMRYDNGAFEFATLTNVKAMYLCTVRDTECLMLWKANNDDENHNRSVSRAYLLDWVTSVTVCNRTTVIDNDTGTVFTASVDFSRGDYDALLYHATIGTLTSDKNTGIVNLQLQGSWDNKVFYDVVGGNFDPINGAGEAWMSCQCKYPYRRMRITVSGTNVTANNIKVVTEPVPRFLEDKITLFDNYGKITGLFEHGTESIKAPWIMQEGNLGSVNKTVYGNEVKYTYDRFNIDEMETTADEWNASTFITSDVYYAFSWLNGIQRYYNTQLEGKGPDKDEGLPFDRQGRISKLLAYPSNFFCAVDGGEDGYSSMLMYNQSGWHEIYRAPNKGERIFDMAFQPIYGDRPDRLYMQVGDEIVWLAMPSKTLNALRDRNAVYTHESVVYSSWITAGMTDIEKLWQSMKITADNLGAECFVEADYRLDDEETWHPIPNAFTTSPMQKEELDPYGSPNGKKLQYRLRLQTTDIHKTPHVNVVVIEAVGRVDIKHSYSFAYRNIKWKKDLNSEYEDVEPLEFQSVILEWANNLEKLRLNSAYKLFDDKVVYCDPPQITVLNELSEGYIGQLTVSEL